MQDLEKLKEKQGDWKSKLSGAFNPVQIFFSLVILGGFYIGYTIFNGLSDVRANYEGDIFKSCYCEHSHQDFYQAWFIIGCILWGLILIYTYIGIRLPAFENFPNLIIKLFRFCKGGLLKCCYNCKKCCKSRSTGAEYTSAATGETNARRPDNGGRSNRNIDVLWFQYYTVKTQVFPTLPNREGFLTPTPIWV